MELLKKHRSVRSYLKKEIQEDVLNEILESGIRASNTGNMQLYCVIVTMDAGMKEQLAPLHFNQSMVKNAPVLLTICFDFHRFNKWCSINGTQADFQNLLWLLNGTIDASLLAQNICIAAENVGLGICYLGTTLYNVSEICTVLNLPTGVVPITTVTIGYPENIPELTDRLPLNSIIHYEKYKNFNESEIKEMYREKELLEASVKFVEENGKENLAKVYTEVRYKKADSEFFSNKLLDKLKESSIRFG